MARTQFYSLSSARDQAGYENISLVIFGPQKQVGIKKSSLLLQDIQPLALLSPQGKIIP